MGKLAFGYNVSAFLAVVILTCRRPISTVLVKVANSITPLMNASDVEYLSSATSPTGESMDDLDSHFGPTNNGVGLSNPQLSHGRRKMLDLVHKLQSTGYVWALCLSPLLKACTYRVQVNIDLPQIAVIGSQSAGKSSLIESISGITLPRAAGTCTRYHIRIC